MKNIKFISYTGKYPTMCDGVLTLEIEGKITKFGHELGTFDLKTGTYKDEDNHERFWTSGGQCRFDNEYNNPIVESGPWELMISELSPEFWDISDELIKVFNENVSEGCCGGCI